jgi:hypothetical protein
MSTREQKEPNTMVEKALARIKGILKFVDHEFEEYYEETHVVKRLPVSYFKKLRAMGFKNATIGQMFGLSEMKVREIMKNTDLGKSITVHMYENEALLESRIMSAKKIVDTNGREVDRNDIIDQIT